MTTHETWKAIPNYEGFYEVSDQGGVRALERLDSLGRPRQGKFLKPDRNRRGYLRVTLHKDNIATRVFVHRLVLETFVGSCPQGMEACHWNDVANDNRLENLRWDSPSANGHDAVRNGGNHNAAKTHCPKGHEYTSENTILSSSGGRECRECNRIRCREYYRENREKIKAKARRSKKEAVLL